MSTGGQAPRCQVYDGGTVRKKRPYPWEESDEDEARPTKRTKLSEETGLAFDDAKPSLNWTLRVLKVSLIR